LETQGRQKRPFSGQFLCHRDAIKSIDDPKIIIFFCLGRLLGQNEFNQGPRELPSTVRTPGAIQDGFGCAAMLCLLLHYISLVQVVRQNQSH
jgi:hypothetical protein